MSVIYRAALVAASVFFAPVRAVAVPPAPPTVPCIETPVPQANLQLISRSPRLGLQFFQDGQAAPLFLPIEADASRAIVHVSLRRAPFEIRVPREAWSRRARNAGLQIAVDDEPCFADRLPIRTSIEKTFMGRFHAMADYPFWTGELATARDPGSDDYGYNYIDTERFDVSTSDYRGLTVSRIERRFGTEDLIQTNAPLTILLYLDRRSGNPPRVRD